MPRCTFRNKLNLQLKKFEREIVAKKRKNGKVFFSSKFVKVGLSNCDVGHQPADTQHNEIQHNDTRHNDTQHNDTHHNDTQCNDTQHKGIQYSNK